MAKNEISARNAFFACFDSEKILQQKTFMGPFNRYALENGCRREWEGAVRGQDQTTAQKIATQLLSQHIGTIFEGIDTNNISLYMLGANPDEIESCVKPLGGNSNCKIIDSSQQLVRVGSMAVPYANAELTTTQHVLDYKIDDLPESNTQNGIIIYPGSQISDTYGYYEELPRDSQFFIDQFERFKKCANRLVLVFDTNKDSQFSKKFYEGQFYKNYVDKSFTSFCKNNEITFFANDQKIELQNLKKMTYRSKYLDPNDSPIFEYNAFRMRSMWSVNTSAWVTTLIPGRNFKVEMDQESIELSMGSPIFARHEYRLDTYEMNQVASKAGWSPKGEPISNQGIVLQTYEL